MGWLAGRLAGWPAGWLAGRLAGEAEVSPFTAPAHKSGDDRHFAYTGRAEVSPFAAPAHKNESYERRVWVELKGSELKHLLGAAS